MYIDCKNCALFDSDECQEYRTDYHSLRTCDNYQAQRYFILAGVEHVSKDGRYRLNSDYERLEQENARLKARLMNIEEGLRRFDDKMVGSGYHDNNYLDYQDGEWHIFKWDGNGICKGKTLADLIDNILIDKQP